MRIQELDYGDLAKMTGYKRSTIRAFMCGCRESDNVANAIASALNIKI